MMKVERERESFSCDIQLLSLLKFISLETDEANCLGSRMHEDLIFFCYRMTLWMIYDSWNYLLLNESVYSLYQASRLLHHYISRYILWGRERKFFYNTTRVSSWACWTCICVCGFRVIIIMERKILPQ